MRNIFLLVLNVLWIGAFAQIPAGYYDNAAGLNGEALKAALHDIIDNHSQLTYDQAKYALMDVDADPQNPANVTCFYTGWSYPATSFGNGSEEWNREHVWSRSHGDFDFESVCGTDLHQLRPTDASVNSAKNNRDFDNGLTEYIDGSGPTGCYEAEDIWEPRDSEKGDVARILFYMAVRYEGDNGEPDLEVVDGVNTAPNNEPFYGNLEELLLWNEMDPVSPHEIERNNKIYSDYQHNRNPFIDHPEYVNRIWGEGVLPEPTNHAGDFSGHNITLNWTDSDGPVLPDGYLIVMSDAGFSDIAQPTDGIPVPNDHSHLNVPFGKQSCIFSQLTPGVMYYFMIFAYTGSGSNIDYKTDRAVPQISIRAR